MVVLGTWLPVRLAALSEVVLLCLRPQALRRENWMIYLAELAPDVADLVVCKMSARGFEIELELRCNANTRLSEKLER